MRKFFKFSFIGLTTIALTVFGADYWVKSNAKIKIFNNVKQHS